MIEVYIDKRFGQRQRLAIQRHVHDRHRNVLSRKLQLYHAGYRPANYPVPAIPYEVQYNEASICIFHRTGPCERDVYILKTI